MQTLSPLQQILARYRTDSKTEREKGNYFEELIRTYLRYEPTYADLYSDIWLLKDVPDEFGISKRDTGAVWAEFNRVGRLEFSGNHEIGLQLSETGPYAGLKNLQSSEQNA